MDKLDELIEIIADSGNEQLQTVFLEWQQEGIERKQKLIDKLDKIASEEVRPNRMLTGKRQQLINFLTWHESENLGYLPNGVENRVDEYLKLI